MNTHLLWGIVIILFVVIVVLAWMLFAVPATTTTPQTPASITPAVTSPQTSTEPLSKSVLVTSPSAGASVGHAFTVSGTAPGPWFFEAVFPIQVRDPNEEIIGRSQGQAQGEWMTKGPVTFTSKITIDTTYHGAATLILMRDNPSGLPENDDSVEVPIMIQ